MNASSSTHKTLSGAEWLIKSSLPEETFIPEDFNEEQRMVMDLCHSFLDAEILPVIDRIEKMTTASNREQARFLLRTFC
jgi:hypothetical protein